MGQGWSIRNSIITTRRNKYPPYYDDVDSVASCWKQQQQQHHSNWYYNKKKSNNNLTMTSRNSNNNTSSSSGQQEQHPYSPVTLQDVMAEHDRYRDDPLHDDVDDDNVSDHYRATVAAATTAAAAATTARRTMNGSTALSDLDSNDFENEQEDCDEEVAGHHQGQRRRRGRHLGDYDAILRHDRDVDDDVAAGARQRGEGMVDAIRVWLSFLILVVTVGTAILWRYRYNQASLSSPQKSSLLNDPAGNNPMTKAVASFALHADATVTQQSWNPFDLPNGPIVNGDDNINSNDDNYGTSSRLWLTAASLSSSLWTMSTTTSSSSLAASNNNDHVTLGTNNQKQEPEGLDAQPPSSRGFCMQPDLRHGVLVFVSEGDLYMTRLLQSENDNNHTTTAASVLPAWKLSTTVGNVRTPKLHPTNSCLVAFSATYSGRRDVYLLHLCPTTTQGGGGSLTSNNDHSQSSPPPPWFSYRAIRLTYWDNFFGVMEIVGWSNDHTLILSAMSVEVSMPDVRLYTLTLAQFNKSDDDNNATLTTTRIRGGDDDGHHRRMTNHHPYADEPDSRQSYDAQRHAQTASSSTQPQVYDIAPVPLSQAREGIYYHDPITNVTCLYFTRFKQTSHTVRYMGGTTESLWAYCDGQTLAVPLTADYNGTSKNPTIVLVPGTDGDKDRNVDESLPALPFLLFLSDRSRVLLNDDDNNSETTTVHWKATTMNVWAMPLPTVQVLYPMEDAALKPTPASFTTTIPLQLTQASCQVHGMAIQEYTVEGSTGQIVLRIGVDLYTISSTSVHRMLQTFLSTTRREGNERRQQQLPSHRSSHRALQAAEIQLLSIQVMSDFHEQQERVIPLKLVKHFTVGDVFDTAFDATYLLMTARGQLFAAPVIDQELDPDLILSAESDDSTAAAAAAATEFQGAGQSLPLRNYRVAPGTMTAGAIRILKTLHVPMPAMMAAAVNASNPLQMSESRRWALVLATDPLSPTAEHAFYMIQVQPGAPNAFANLNTLPEPFLGGHVNAGSVANGGLGSIDPTNLVVSPCGRRLAWTDKEGRICIMNVPRVDAAGNLIPLSSSNATTTTTTTTTSQYQVLPKENELGEVMYGTVVDALAWSPGGRYLAISHNAQNQFSVISIADCGDPNADDGNAYEVAAIRVGRIVQATPSRFNSFSPCWGRTGLDTFLEGELKELSSSIGVTFPQSYSATTLYFLSDRDIQTDVSSPWGNRQPSPHFPRKVNVYGIPLIPVAAESDPADSERIKVLGRFAGGGAQEVTTVTLNAFERDLVDRAKKAGKLEATRRKLREWSIPIANAIQKRSQRTTEAAHQYRYLENTPSAAPSAVSEEASPFPIEMDIAFGEKDLSFGQRAYRLAHIPEGHYAYILSQTTDDGSLVIGSMEPPFLVSTMQIFACEAFPSDIIESKRLPHAVFAHGLSTSRDYIYLVFANGAARVVPNKSSSLLSFVANADSKAADLSGLFITVWPELEYRQIYGDAWRMMRDYFYDPNMHGVDWTAVFDRYEPLVNRCTKREELDDVLAQMASELSALHVFAYGGETADPMHGDTTLGDMLTPGSLGAFLRRTPEWKGYMVTQIPERDPDFSLVSGSALYSPLSSATLSLSGQIGLQVGDVIVGVNGESVMMVPSIYMLLRGTAGRSVRLEVLRLASAVTGSDQTSTSGLITVPISPFDSKELLYRAWEWKTSSKAKDLAAKAGFTVGYTHLQAMLSSDENDFATGFFPDYNKEGFILDLRHNRGGNIDSWIISVLQRKAWEFWGDRTGARTGDIDWDEQFAFRGHVVVLIDELTASDAENVARGISELGLGVLIGTRTWGGGIWLKSDNVLVDGGIATAPETGTFNKRFGWGMGIEQQGVVPDIEVDNNPRTAYDGIDSQLEMAIQVLAERLKREPVAVVDPPLTRPDRSLSDDTCHF